jgi:hypothetical protein
MISIFETEYPFRFLVKLIVTEFIKGIEPHKNNCSNSDGQTDHLNDRLDLVRDDVPEGGDDMIP